jgi:dTDP-4-amino-4,6-dideoxygalactose transaminase
LADTTLALPVFPELAKEQIEYVVQKINEFITE